MKDIIARGTINNKVQAHILLINKISPIKLMVGGAAILQIQIKNHHSVIEGMS
jgi:hypothetical protein